MPIVRKISHTDVLNPKDMFCPSPAYDKLFECEIKFELNTPLLCMCVDNRARL